MNYILTIIAFNLIVYFRTLRNTIILDDLPWLAHRQKNDLRTNLKNSGCPTWKAVYYDLLDRLYGAGTFGLNIEIEHLFRIFLNCLTSVLIYIAFGNNNISFWAAMLWIANPLNNQLTMWLNGRRFIINVILVLLIIIYPLAGLILYPLTLALQVSAVFVPVLFIDKYPWLLLGIPIVLAFGFKKLMTRLITRFERVHDSDRKIFTWKRIYIIVKDYGHFFFKMIIPRTCVFIYPMRYYWGITEKGNKEAYSFNYDFYKGIIALCLSILGIYLLPNIYKPMAVFAVLATLQWCAIIPAIQDLADRYASLPNVFMMFFLSYLINTHTGQYALPILTGFIVYYTALLYDAMKPYRGMEAYWEHARYHFPELPAPLKYEIGHYLRTDVNKAWMLAKDGLRYNPTEYTLLQQAAVCHKIIGNLEVAKEFAEMAAKNYYIGQKHIEEPKIQAFINNLGKTEIQVSVNDSRQVRRAKERELKKKI